MLPSRRAVPAPQVRVVRTLGGNIGFGMMRCCYCAVVAFFAASWIFLALRQTVHPVVPQSYGQQSVEEMPFETDRLFYRGKQRIVRFFSIL